MKLFVAGLPNDFDETDLREMFELYGDVRSAKLIVDRATGKSKGFGFIEMPDRNEALQTIEALDGAGLKGGKKIAIKEAEEQNRNTGFSGGSSGYNRNNSSPRDSNRDNNRDNRFNRR